MSVMTVEDFVLGIEPRVVNKSELSEQAKKIMWAYGIRRKVDIEFVNLYTPEQWDMAFGNSGVWDEEYDKCYYMVDEFINYSLTVNGVRNIVADESIRNMLSSDKIISDFLKNYFDEKQMVGEFILMNAGKAFYYEIIVQLTKELRAMKTEEYLEKYKYAPRLQEAVMVKMGGIPMGIYDDGKYKIGIPKAINNEFSKFTV